MTMNRRDFLKGLVAATAVAAVVVPAVAEAKPNWGKIYKPTGITNGTIFEGHKCYTPNCHGYLCLRPPQRPNLLDGLGLQVGDTIHISQASEGNNGIYEVTSVGDGGATLRMGKEVSPNTPKGRPGSRYEWPRTSTRTQQQWKNARSRKAPTGRGLRGPRRRHPLGP